MNGFRIERSRFGNAPRVYHESNNRLAVALILKEDDGQFTLFPVCFDGAPYPLTGRSMTFPDESHVRLYLGIYDREDAA